MKCLIVSSRFMNSFIDLCRALGNERRVRMYISIHERGQLAVCDLADEIGISEPAASFHLKKLLRVGLIKQRRDGKFTLSSSGVKNI
ncbi:TPA: hypothetical protein DDZ10_04380 [Candidatus Uhrbacteria bacterium]|nr:hypothetical protein [Candidatus Uhrbacteria bacterium]